MNINVLTVTALAFACALSCAKEIPDLGSSKVDFKNPKRVLASVFYAAGSADAAHLKTLCDPQGENDGDTQRICDADPAKPGWTEFVLHFEKAHLAGEPRVTADRAVLNFTFGPNGGDSETMELIKRNGSWYLYSF